MSTATVALGVQPAAQRSVSGRRDYRQLWRRVFSDKAERSSPLRALTLLAALWVVGSLILVGVSPLVPLLSAAGFGVGHAVSDRFRRRRLPWLSLAVAVFIVAVGIGMRFELVAAIRGDRVPVALFLLATGAASSFELRTRGGLYTQIIFSGIVMFFASEMAFGMSFSVLLGGFGLIVLAFLATAHVADQTENASVARFGNRARETAFWAAVGAGLLVLSTAAFLLLPWNRDQTPQGARLSILPFNGAEDGVQSGITPEMARELLKQSAHEAGGQGESDASDGSGWLGQEGGGTMAGQGIGGADLVGEGRVPDWARPLVSDDAGNGVVAYVRSPVSSYWRGRVYDTYGMPEDGAREQWYATVGDDRHLGSVFVTPRQMGDEEQRYLQTFFAERDFGDAVLAGYDPLAIAVQRDRDLAPAVRSGAVYQVVSRQPRTSADGLRADRVRWQGREYAALPASWGSLHSLTAYIARDAKTDFDKAAAIASYLHGLEYADDALDPLEPKADMYELVLGEGSGSAIDFATAMVLMARSAGLPARLATGYLPGNYSAYSGAAAIDSRDAHAWAEISFQEAGWVPFDAAPRSDLPSAASVGKPPPGGLSFLLDHRFGGGLADAISRAPGGLRNGIEAMLENGLKAVLTLLGLAIAVTIGWLAYSRIRAPRKDRDFSYVALPGRPRVEMIGVFRRLESILSRRGFRRRRSSEPFHDYVAAAMAATAAAPADLRWLADAASRAAYCQETFPADTARSARERLRRIRAAL